ncbi:hypothetical protein [uncultured Hymenobacter sp.]|uniref:hypothetical protein n=1 Tax=uncultured Hymenobacter sp. TaxID=170016 RepID=UPI0035CA90EC
MFDHPLFDTLIALITLYLLFSQLTLSLVELPAGFLNTRGSYLYNRLREALGPDIHDKFYKAASIQSIASPKTEKTLTFGGLVKLHPAYISETLFAQTITACVIGPAPAAGLTPIAQFKAGLDTLISEASADTAPTGSKEADTSASRSEKPAPTTPPPNPNANFTGTLQTLYTNAISVGSTAEDQSKALHQNLEHWFHDFGERLTGRYKRDNRKYLFGMGLLVALLADVDTVRLARFLADSNNAKARTALVATGVTATQGARPTSLDYDLNNATQAAEYEKREREWSTALKTANTELKNTLAAVPQVGLPLGFLRWNNTDVVRSDTTTHLDKVTGKRTYAKPGLYSWALTADDYKMPPYARRWKLDEKTGHSQLLGASFFLLPISLWSMIGSWLLTALAMMLGAPFWFDTLCRFVNIRNVGIKPAPTDKTST